MVSSIGLAASGFGGLGATLSGGYVRIFWAAVELRKTKHAQRSTQPYCSDPWDTKTSSIWMNGVQSDCSSRYFRKESGCGTAVMTL